MYLDHSKEQVYIPVVETLATRTLQIQKKTNQQVKFKMDWPMPFVVAKFEENPESLWIQDRLTARWCKNEWWVEIDQMFKKNCCLSSVNLL